MFLMNVKNQIRWHTSLHWFDDELIMMIDVILTIFYNDKPS